jgi:hypothetical protein
MEVQTHSNSVLSQLVVINSLPLLIEHWPNLRAHLESCPELAVDIDNYNGVFNFLLDCLKNDDLILVAYYEGALTDSLVVHKSLDIYGNVQATLSFAFVQHPTVSRAWIAPIKDFIARHNVKRVISVCRHGPDSAYARLVLSRYGLTHTRNVYEREL